VFNLCQLLIIYGLLLLEVLLVAHCLVVKGLAVLEDLHLILIKLYRFVVLQSLVNNFLRLVLVLQVQLSGAIARNRVAVPPFNVEHSDLLPKLLNE
jgi:hypothetical protein